MIKMDKYKKILILNNSILKIMKKASKNWVNLIGNRRSFSSEIYSH